MYGWNTLPWTRIQRQVFKLQKRIYRASCRHDVRTVRKLQRLLLHSWSARLLAVRQVTQDNRGKRTAGVDGVKSLTPPNASPWHSPSPSTAPPPCPPRLDPETSLGGAKTAWYSDHGR